MKMREGVEIATAAAWAKKGERNPNLFIYRHVIAGAMVVAAIGAAGYGVYRLVLWAGEAARGDGAGVPSLMWILGAFLLVSSLIAVRGTGKVRSFGTLAILAVGIGAAWLFWLGALVSMLV